MLTKQEAGKVVTKFRMSERKGKHLFYSFHWKGKLVLTTAIPKGKGPMNCRDKFRNQLCLNQRQLDEAVRCSFNLPDLIEHLFAIGEISEDA